MNLVTVAQLLEHLLTATLKCQANNVYYYIVKNIPCRTNVIKLILSNDKIIQMHDLPDI